LYISIIVVTIITIVSAISFFILSTINYRDNVISEYIKEKSSKAINHFSDKAVLIENNIQLLTKWGGNGLLNIDDTSNIDLVFIPLIEDVKDIYAITVFEESGNEYEVKKDGEAYLSRYYKAGKQNTDKAFKWRQLDKTGKEIGTWEGSIDYKPSKKAWSENAQKKSLKLNWFGPYFSKSLNKNVVSISSSWTSNNQVYYIVIHVLLKDIFGFFDIIELRQHEYSFLLSNDGDIYDFQGSKSSELHDKISGNMLITPYYKNTIPEIAEAVNIWLDEDKNTENSLPFKIGNTSYWSKFEYFNKEKGKYIFGIVVSESSFSVKMGKDRFENLLLSLLITFIGFIAALFFILRYNRLLRQVPKPGINSTNFERDITSLSKSPESKTLEFKSTIRFNLRTEKNDKAIEHAWLKSVAAFLNTDGGVLLIGVNDEGNFQGIEKDNFENTDKASLHIKNLVNRYIGIEYMKFVNIHSGNLNNRPIIALVCKQATKPAYLNLPNEELFYIRIGPSSTKLTVSQAVEHIVNHGYKQYS
jgi:hypothetical protein